MILPFANTAEGGTEQMRVEPLSEDCGAIIRPEFEREILSLNTYDLIELFKSVGVILFRFPCNHEEFELFTKQFGQTFIPHTNTLRKIISGDGSTMTVTPGGQEIYVHSEMSYSPFRPDLVWFRCAMPAPVGGETLLCDGVRVLQRMHRMDMELFRAKRIKYMYRDISKWGSFLGMNQSVASRSVPLAAGFPGAKCRFDEDGTLNYFEYSVSAISSTKFTNEDAFSCSLLDWGYSFEDASFEDDTPITLKLLEDLRELTDQSTFQLKLESNDILMIDNTRIMHGRLGYDDSSRCVHVRMCNVNF